MPSEPRIDNTGRDFLSVASRLAMLGSEQARQLASEASTRELSPMQLVLQKGLLSTTQVDIVETLLRPETVVPGYELLDVIGYGGMGVVYRARQKNLDRIVALKTILISQMSDANILARFEHEAKTVARLRHPNIIAAYDFGRHAGRLFFAMELVEGEDGLQLIDRNKSSGRLGRLAEELAWGIARQAAAGLAHAAQADIVHRDIKPANLLLVDPPEGFPLPPGLPMVKIADFGLALLTENVDSRTRLTAANMTVGSPQYMAPEQIADGIVDLRADIYALGATVFHLLAGVPPYAGLTLTQILARKLNSPPPQVREICPHVSQETNVLLERMMTLDATQRIADYNSLIAGIDAILRTATATSTDQGTLPTTVVAKDRLPPDVNSSTTLLPGSLSRLARRRTRRLVVAGLLGLSAVVTLVAAWPALFAPAAPSAGERDLVPSAWAEYLFDGRNMADWIRNASGLWNLAKDAEGGRVLSGTNGVVRNQLVRGSGKDTVPVQFFRLTMSVCLNEATAVELHFAIASTADGNGPRNVLRASADGVSLGRKSDNAAPLEPITDPKPLLRGPQVFHEIVLERQRTSWWVFLENQLVGTLPLGADAELPEFRLAAESGPAWFSDILVEELVPPPAG